MHEKNIDIYVYWASRPHTRHMDVNPLYNGLTLLAYLNYTPRLRYTVRVRPRKQPIEAIEATRLPARNPH